eukprot:jgi/Mesen1/8987/ME000056S08393
MLRTKIRTMALSLQQAFTPALIRGSSGVVTKLNSARSAVVSSPISRPWWRSLSDSLSVSAAGIGSARVVTWSSRRFTTVSQAADGDVGVTAVAEPEAEPEAGAEEEVAPVKVKSLTKKVKHIMNLLDEEQRGVHLKDKIIPDFRPGDVLALRVEVPENKRRVSLLRGIVIARRNAGINSTFRIRRVMAGVGVEMVFPLYSPNIKELKVVDRRKARRAKLYYLRDKIARLSTVN